MTADDFVKIVRKGAEKLRADNIVLLTEECEIRGKGMLKIGREEIELDMTLDSGQNPVPTRTGIFTPSDYWKLSGIIEDSINFKCDYVSGGAPRSFIHWDKRKEMITFHLSPIELIPSGWDALSREERKQVQAHLRSANGVIETNTAECSFTGAEGGAVHFSALIANYPLPRLLCKGTKIIETNPYFGGRSSGRLDTIMGEIENFEFALIKESDKADLEIYLKSKASYQSPGEIEDWNNFHALMNGLAFIIGVHAWPYRIEYWRNGPKIVDRVTAARRLARTVHAPFRLQNFDFQDVIGKATTFFASNSVLSEEVKQILFLFREAADYETVHGDITVLSTCVLFESLVNQIFKELELESRAIGEIPEIQDFQNAKLEIALQLKALATSKGSGYERLHRLVSNAQLFTMRERLRAVANYFGLPWENDIEIVFRTWQKARDPIVHGKRRTGLPESEVKDLMLAESRIAGAMNILVLKLIGYSGKMAASVFEDAYRTI